MSGQKMKAPPLRFGVSHGSWKRYRLGDSFRLNVSTNTLSRAELSNNGIVRNVHYGDVLVKYGSVLDVANEKMSFVADHRFKCDRNNRLVDGDIIMADTAEDETVGKVTEIHGIDELAVVSGLHTIVLRPNDKHAEGFLGYCLNAPAYHGNLVSVMQGSKVLSINKSMLADSEYYAPSTLTEQHRIGSFFHSIDALIAEREKALGKLEALKKSMLLKMFPQGDALVPAVRFKGFVGNWEKTRLGNFGDCQSGEGFPEIEQGGNAGVPFFKVSDMNLPGNKSELIYANNYVTEEQIRRCAWHPVVKLPAIIFAKVGAAVMLNRKRIVRKRFLLDNNTMAFRLDDSIDVDFAKSLFDTIDLPALSQASALPSINASDVEHMLVMIPLDHVEQQKIGAYFRSLDALIAARREEVEKLRQMKKALLERMFV